MKRLFLTSLSIIAVSLGVSTSVQARGHTEILKQPITTISNNSHTKRNITPFNLIGNAYQGAYRDHSIPGFASLRDGARIGRITAKDLVKAAIESEDLSPQKIDDLNYLRSVEVQLGNIRH
jgi:hypothetical protein